MKTYKATTINGESHLEEVNPFNPETELYDYAHFNAYAKLNTAKLIGPAIPDGTILDESEVEIKTEGYSDLTGKWHEATDQYLEKYKLSNITFRRVATWKAKEPENGSRLIGTFNYDLKNGIETYTPASNSEEGEQPMKEVLPIGHAETFLKDRYKKQFVKDLPAISGYSLPGLLEAYINELKQQGYTLTKK